MRPSDAGDSGDTISYPVALLRSVANQIITDVTQAQDEHTKKWNEIVNYINSADSNLQDPMRQVFNTHNQKLQASYQWQADFASTLYGIADLAEALDENIAQTFS